MTDEQIARELVAAAKQFGRIAKVPGNIKRDMMETIKKRRTDGKHWPDDKDMRDVVRDDAKDLEQVLWHLQHDQPQAAWAKAQGLDTLVREFIPDTTWDWMEENADRMTDKPAEKETGTSSWRKGLGNVVRRELDDVPSSGKLVFSRYLEETRGTSNKFHFFAVFEYKDEDGDEAWAAGNAYGRIGKNPKVSEIRFKYGSYFSKDAAIAEVKKKLKQKMSKGYKEASSMTDDQVARELVAAAKLLTADDSAVHIDGFLQTISTLESDIKKAKSELRRGQLGRQAGHLAYSLAGGRYTDDGWYEQLYM